MSKELEAGVAKIQEGAKNVLLSLESLSHAESESASRLDILALKIAEKEEALDALEKGIEEARKDLNAAQEDAKAATAAAQDKAAVFVAAGQTEAKRLIKEAEASCKVVIDLREAARAEFNDLRADIEEATKESAALRAHTAKAKEDFLKAVSH